jgi:hypothetical protein
LDFLLVKGRTTRVGRGVEDAVGASDDIVDKLDLSESFDVFG